ncbi:MAG: hypothetical protein OEZ06_29605 [Myxococcales bacterium]|nr:hypothetical protein [Myxococcales bacterium]
MAWLDRCIAMCQLEYFGQRYPDGYTETIWCDQSYNDLLLTNHAAVQDKPCYTVLNSVKDRLVPDYKQWPGVLHGPSDWLKPQMKVSRPQYFFDQTDEEFAVATGCFVTTAAVQRRPAARAGGGLAPAAQRASARAGRPGTQHGAELCRCEENPGHQPLRHPQQRQAQRKAQPDGCRGRRP